MKTITYEESLARNWLRDRDEKQKSELKDKNDKSHNADYDFY